MHPRTLAVGLAVCLSLSAGAVAPAHASTITGKLVGAKLPAKSAGVASVRAVDPATLAIAAAARVRSARYKLTVPAGRYVLLATTTPFRGQARIDRPVGTVTLRTGARKTLRLTFKRRVRRSAARAAQSFVPVKYPAVWVKHFEVSGPSELSALRKGLADMLITDLMGIKAKCGGVIVEREKLGFLIAEQKLSQSPAGDPSTRIPSNRMIGHNREVTGSLTVTGGTATLTVFVKNTVTGSRRSVTRTAPIAQFFELEQSVVPEVIRLICAPELPSRFDGTWTRVHTDPSRGSWQVTVTGSATFVRTTAAGANYGLTNSSVTWTAAGSRSSGSCTTTYSGGGSGTAVPAHPTLMSLEDVSDRPEAPKPEPTPFYYAIWVHGNEGTPHPYDVTVTCPGGSNTYQDAVSTAFLQIGFRDWWATNPPEIMKTADATLLEGRRSRTPAGGTATYEDSWSFKGSE